MRRGGRKKSALNRKLQRGAPVRGGRPTRGGQVDTGGEHVHDFWADNPAGANWPPIGGHSYQDWDPVTETGTGMHGTHWHSDTRRGGRHQYTSPGQQPVEHTHPAGSGMGQTGVATANTPGEGYGWHPPDETSETMYEAILPDEHFHRLKPSTHQGGNVHTHETDSIPIMSPGMTINPGPHSHGG